MTFAIDKNLSWTEHYIEYGFAVVKGMVDRAWCEKALAEVRRVVEDDRPLAEWDAKKPGRKYTPFYQDPGRTGWTEQNTVLETLYDQPRLRAGMDELFGDPNAWDGARNYYIFLNPYQPDAKAELDPMGHIDFGDQPVPVLYRGFTFQIALAQTEPFAGNITIFPGTHKLVLKALTDEPSLVARSGTFAQIPRPLEPYEFVAEPGDVMFMHHLVFHSGNPSHAPSRGPRVGIHAEAFRANWLTEVDPANPKLSPWERSLAMCGHVKAAYDEAAHQRKIREKYIQTIEAEKKITIDEKWKRYSDWPTPPIA